MSRRLWECEKRSLIFENPSDWLFGVFETKKFLVRAREAYAQLGRKKSWPNSLDPHVGLKSGMVDNADLQRGCTRSWSRWFPTRCAPSHKLSIRIWLHKVMQMFSAILDLECNYIQRTNFMMQFELPEDPYNFLAFLIFETLHPKVFFLLPFCIFEFFHGGRAEVFSEQHFFLIFG